MDQRDQHAGISDTSDAIHVSMARGAAVLRSTCSPCKHDSQSAYQCHGKFCIASAPMP